MESASVTIDADIPDFVTRFAAAWAARDPAAFTALWHADGRLHYPFSEGGDRLFGHHAAVQGTSVCTADGDARGSCLNQGPGGTA